MVSSELSPPQVCSLSIFLNDRKACQLASKLAEQCQINASWGTQVERVNYAQAALAQRAISESRTAKLLSRQHAKIDEILPAALAKAINTIRELDFFCDHFDTPPAAATSARRHVGEAITDLLRLLPSCSGLSRPRLVELIASESCGLSFAEEI